MMGASGVLSGYYPTDSNGVMVQNELSAPCKCAAIAPTALPVCPPLGYGSCRGCGELSFPLSAQVGSLSGLSNAAKAFVLSVPIYGNWCGPGYPSGRRQYANCDSNSSPPAIDELDSCCCKHDQCYDVNNCSGVRLALCACRDCDCGLLACAYAASCRSLTCLGAWFVVILFMGLACWRPCISELPKCPPSLPTPPRFPPLPSLPTPLPPSISF